MSSVISIGKKPVYRGVYNSTVKYYSENMVAMCACMFQCVAPSIVGVPPITIDGSGRASFANTSSWNVVIDNLSLYNNITYVEEKTSLIRNTVDEFVVTISDDWAEDTDYVVGNYVIRGGALYECISAHNSGSTFDPTKWEQTTIANMVDTLSADIIRLANAISSIVDSDIYLTESEYEALVEAGEVDPDKRYFTYEDE